jgi:hypothetical protein
MKDNMVKLKERKRKSLKKKNEVLLWSTFNLMLLEFFKTNILSTSEAESNQLSIFAL